MLQAPVQQSKFRQDLIVSHQQAAPGVEDPTFIIKDPETGRFFRFREIEHFIAQQLDGSNPPETIRRQVEERFRAPLSQDSLEQFIKTLRRLGLLDEGGKSAKTAGHGPFRGSLLYFRIKLFDPDRLFNRLVGKVKFFFTPAFLLSSAAVILLAVGLVIANLEEIGRELGRLARIETILWVWAAILAVTAAHECAHGLTCKHYGGQVREMGFLLLYFQPCLYCNVSDAWLFKEKSKRLWVTFAGPYFELFLWALVVVAWRVTDQETWLNQAALVVMATSGVMTLLDFNPLMKRDGYYFLSDYLDMPNLRKRAFDHLGSRARGLFGLRGKAPAPVAPREGRIYLWFGMLAGAYSAAVLGGVSMILGNLLIENYQGAGFLLFSALLPVVLRQPLKQSLRAVPALVKSFPDSLAAAGRAARLVLIAAILLGALFWVRMELTVWGEFRVVPIHNTDIRAEVEGIITEIHVREGDVVRQGDPIALLSGRELNAERKKTEAEMDAMTAKLKLLKAGPRQEEVTLAQRAVETARTKHEKALEVHDQAQRMQAEKIAKAETGVEKAQKQFEEAQRIKAEHQAKARSTVAKAEERVKYKQMDVARLKGLLDRGFFPQKDFQAAEEELAVRQKELEEARGELKLVLANSLAEEQKLLEEARGELKLLLADDLTAFRNDIEVARRDLEEARGRLSVLLAGSRKEEIEGTEAELARLASQQRYQLDQIRLLEVLSPASGVITTPTRQLQEMIGQHVAKGELIAEVHEMATVTAEIAVSEKEIADVVVGQDVVLKARSYPGRSFEGKVRAIATTAGGKLDGGAGSTVLVLTQLDNSSRLLKPEMTGNAKIFCGQRRLVDLATRRIARYVKVEVWSWW